MTTSDLWITNLAGGRSLGQHGGLISHASYVAWTLLDFIDAGRIAVERRDVANIDAVVSGEMLIEVMRAAEQQNGVTLTERDGSLSVECVNPDDTYRVEFIEF